jgi:SAM-dependent methyltransferase
MNVAAPVRTGAVLHVGCGGNPLPDWLDGEETRLDIDPQHNPDVVASMTDMGDIGGFDLLYCSHSLEHLYPHDVPVALSEFRRVLKDGGQAIVIVPDLEDVTPTSEPLLETPAGPVCGLDMIYGMSRLIADNEHMAHHFGFIAETLTLALKDAGFSGVRVLRGNDYNLIGAARK